ncbi:MAG: hypothetical protein J7K62_02135 [Thermoplasmata archaeon]|nr:hypothetical protein [Thermoplasmata archaeon]
MYRKLISPLLLIVVLIGIALLWSMKSPSQEIATPCEISEEITRIVAEKQLEHQKASLMEKEFRNGIIASESPIVFRDLNGRCICHCYKVIDANDNHYLGYIVISAIRSLPPFLASSASKLPTDNLERCRVIARKKIGADPTSYSLLYLEDPVINYFVRFQFAEGRTLIMSLRPIGIFSEEEAIRRQKVLGNRITKGKSEAEAQWQHFLSE